ncbi:hypothetical protein QE397_001034 [Rhodococcus sp. SORGH_AS 301]|nr:hypothetical protein [Rhodococcus sp. SORGH_AS_0301]
MTGSDASEPVVSVPRTRTQYFRAWSELHGGYDVHSSALVHGWLTITYVLARPLARARVAPTAVTAVGVLFAVLALAVAGSGPWGAGAAALLLVLSALVDSLDGAVALLRGRSTAFGYVADSVADRLSDMLVFAVLLVLGAPAPLVVAVALLTLLHETARARAVSAGMASIGVVTVWGAPVPRDRRRGDSPGSLGGGHRSAVRHHRCRRVPDSRRRRLQSDQRVDPSRSEYASRSATRSHSRVNTQPISTMMCSRNSHSTVATAAPTGSRPPNGPDQSMGIARNST